MAGPEQTPRAGASSGERSDDSGRGEPPESLRVKLLTPSGTLFDGEAQSVAALAEGGALEILPDHGALMSPLDIGLLTIASGAEADRFAVHGGFVEVRGDEVRILAEGAERRGDIDPARARAAAERARKRLAGELSGRSFDRARARRSLRRAEARLSLSGEK